MSKKKTTLVCVAVAIIFSILGYSVGASYTKYKFNFYLNHGSSANSSNNTNVENKKEKGVKTIALNQEEVLGNSSIKILNSKEEESVSTKSGSTTSSGKFIIIELELKNNANEAINYSADQFQLIDNNKVYRIDDVAFDTMSDLNSQETIYNKNNEFIGVYDSFNPGMSKKTYIVFDVPKDISIDNAKLIVNNNKDIQFSIK